MMSCFANHIVNFIQEESGPTAVEYAVMLAMIIVVCIVAINSLGAGAGSTFNFVGSKIQGDAGS